MPSIYFIFLISIAGRILWSRSIKFKDTFLEELVFFLSVVLVEIIIFALFHYVFGIDFRK